MSNQTTIPNHSIINAGLKNNLCNSTFFNEGDAYFVDILYDDNKITRQFRVVPPNLGVGSLGIIIALSDLISENDLLLYLNGISRSIYSEWSDEPSLGFMDGVGGLIYFQWFLKKSRGISFTLIDNYLDLVCPLTRLNASSDNDFALDFFHGASGYVFAVAEYGTERMCSNNAIFFTHFVEACKNEYLIQKNNLCFSGFAHGRLGAAHSLQALGLRLSDHSILELAQNLVDMEQDRISNGILFDARSTVSDTPQIKRMFCNGYLGFGLIQGWKKYKGLDYSKIELLPVKSHAWNSTFCHGYPLLYWLLKRGISPPNTSIQKNLRNQFEHSFPQNETDYRNFLVADFSLNSGRLSALQVALDIAGKLQSPNLFDILTGNISD